MRALFDPDFHIRLTSNPDEALKEYKLTKEEAKALKNPSPDLYKFLQPGSDVLKPEYGVLMVPDGGTPPPPPPVTVVVIVVVAITVFVAAATGPGLGGDISARYSTLLNAIEQSSGYERIDLVKTLVNELTRGQ
jgi:hypothetical protein